MRKIFFPIFIGILFFYNFAFANPVYYVPHDYVADPADVLIKFSFFSLIFYIITAFVESITYFIFLSNLAISKINLLKISFKINLLTFPLTQMFVMIYYYIVMANKNFFINRYASYRFPVFWELAVSIGTIVILIFIGFIFYYRYSKKYCLNILEKRLVFVFITTLAIVLADIFLFLIFENFYNKLHFDFFSNFIQFEIGSYKVMESLATRYHLNFFKHYINIFLEILVAISEFFLLKHYIFKLKNNNLTDSRILTCVIFANVFSLLTGDLLMYIYRDYFEFSKFNLDHLLYFF